MHIVSEPNILYSGTPVVLISTTNEDGSYNLAPMSSAFWLGWRCLLGLAGVSKTTENVRRTGECVLNLPSVDNIAAVNLLARTTGSDPVPAGKIRKGYRFERDKFGISGLTPVPSLTVSPPRVLECPVQLEAKIEAIHGVADDDDVQRGGIKCIEARIQRVHLEESILMNGDANRIDPDKWRPLIMSFQHFYGLGPQLHDSTLAQIPEAAYRVRTLLALGTSRQCRRCSTHDRRPRLPAARRSRSSKVVLFASRCNRGGVGSAESRDLPCRKGTFWERA